MTTEQILKQEFDILANDLIARHKELGMPASGDWIKSIEVGTTFNSGTIYGEGYTEYLEDGRKPGGFPPVDAIKKWIQDKGIQSELPINSLAYLIGRKIAKEGWKRQKHGGVNLVSQVITPRRVQEIMDRIGTNLMVQLMLNIQTTIKTA